MVWPEHPFDESVDDNPAPDDALRVVHHARPVQLHTLNVPNMTTRPTNRQIWPKSKNSVEYREEVWIVYFRPMAEGLVDLQDRSICLNLKIGEIEIDQNRSIETIMWKSVGDVQWRSGEVRGSNYLKNLLLTSGSPSHPAVRANSLFNHNSGENPKNLIKCWCWTWERWERNQVGDQLGRPPASPPASSRVYISGVSSPRSNPLSDVRSYDQATSWFPPASSTLCTLASAAPRSSSWTPPRKSWRCDGQDAAGCPTLSRCTWQREQIIWCPDIFKWCHQYLNTLNWALICPTKDFPFSSNHGKIILCWVFIVLLTTVKFLAHLSTQWPSTTKCFHTTLTRASEPICANRFLKGGL